MKTFQHYIFSQILCSCLCFGMAIAEDESANAGDKLDSLPSLDSVTCTKEVLMTFFPKPVVKAILVQHKITEEKAQQIAQELAQKDREVVKLVELKASEMNPNPFSDLSYRDTAIRLFRETLYEVFAKVLKAHQITDENEIQHLLEDMQAVKGKLFVECIKKEYEYPSKSQP